MFEGTSGLDAPGLVQGLDMEGKRNPSWLPSSEKQGRTSPLADTVGRERGLVPGVLQSFCCREE